FLDVDIVDLICAAPKVKRNGGDARAVARNFRQLTIDVIAHPEREIDVHDDNGARDNNEQPKPPASCERLHSPFNPMSAVCNCINRTRFGRGIVVFTCPDLGDPPLVRYKSCFKSRMGTECLAATAPATDTPGAKLAQRG